MLKKSEDALPDPETRRSENLSAAAKGEEQPHSELSNTALGVLRDTLSTAHAATEPKSVGLMAAGAVAPVVTGAALLRRVRTRHG